MKYPGRRIRITYEGFSFMSVLAFIIIGSIIRQINLLVLLSGLMIAPFFFNWRIAMKMLERLRAARHLPDWVHAGTPFNVRWKICNDRQRIPAWGVRVVDHIRQSGETAADQKMVEQVAISVPPVSASSETGIAYRCLVPSRGVCEFGKADVSSAFPVGLIRARVMFPEWQSLVVAPSLGKLTRSWTQLIGANNEYGQTTRQKRNNQDGEFYALRPWSSGDNPRQVHWRSSAKHGELLVRQLEQDVDQQLVLVLDLASGNVGAADIEFALSFFTSVVVSTARGRTRPTIGIFGDQPLVIERFERQSMSETMTCLAGLQPSESTDLVAGMDRLSGVARNSRYIVISTRSRNDALEAADARESQLKNCRWIDLAAGEGHAYFEMLPDQTDKFIHETVEAAGNGAA